MKILTASQIRAWDQFTIEECNMRSIDLMEQAAAACYQWLRKHHAGKCFFIFCGPGNNGGDGLAIGRMLMEAGEAVQLFYMQAEKYSPDFEENFQRYLVTGHYKKMSSAEDLPVIPSNGIVIDAIFGTGLSKAPSGIVTTIIDHINTAETTVISIDLPSGMFCEKSSVGNSIIKANTTLSFQQYKLCLLLTENLPFTGEVVLLDIGLSASFLKTCETNFETSATADMQLIFKPRKPWVHKYNVGSALFFAGSAGMMGAAALATKACLRSGAGLATLAHPTFPAGHFSIFASEVIHTNGTDIETLLHKKTAICFGPGLTNNKENEQLLKDLVHYASVPMLVDATGISILKNINGLSEKVKVPLIITPHTGEFAMLFEKHANDFDRLFAAIAHATTQGIYIVLKGPHSIVATPAGKLYFNINGNSGMATAGAGDVLSGIITALLAQGYTAEDACRLGVYIHGAAGDQAAAEHSKESMIATDIIEQLGAVFLQLNRAKTNNE